LRRLSELEPGNPRAWYLLGKSYEALSQHAFERLDKLAQGSAWWLALVAGTRLSEQQYGAAFGLYREALAKMPGLRGAHAALAEIYRNTGHADWAAVEEKREPRAPDCTRPTQECAFRAGRFLEAVRGAQPPTPSSYYWQSRACNELARQAFSGLAQLPPSAELHRLRAQMESNRRRYPEAVKELREALKMAPRDPQVRIELASALHSARDDHAAQAVLEELLKADPEAAPLNFMYGDTLLSLEQPEKAIPYLEKALRRDPKQLRVRGALGVAYARTGQAERAIPHLKAALELDPDGSLHYQLARAYQATGQAELAKPLLEKYQEFQRRAQPEKPQITAP
jgi:predicted Zn-dependent protease